MSSNFLQNASNLKDISPSTNWRKIPARMAEGPHILLLGASGYIGGSILNELLQHKKDNYTISAIVRNYEQFKTLLELGVIPLKFESLDDFKTIKSVAIDHDMVIGAASARHEGAAQAIIEGLAERHKYNGKEVHYIHTSGTSMIADWPVTGERVDTSIHSDVDEDIYLLEKNFPESYSPVRKVDQFVVDFGLKNDVNTYIVPPPLIFGRGTGPFGIASKGSGQVHMMVQLALQKKQAVMMGTGSGIWNRIYINDLSHLYFLLFSKIISGNAVPSGKLGYYFAENGFQSWKSIAEGIGKAGKEMRLFERDEVGEISLKDVAKVFYNGDLRDAEAVLGSNSRTKADRARQVLGWKPEYGEEAFEQEIKDVVELMSKNLS